jgi:hypothetical protein
MKFAACTALYGRHRSNFLRTIGEFARFDVEALSRCVLGRGMKSAKTPRF